MKANILELPLPQTKNAEEDTKNKERSNAVLRMVPQKYEHTFFLFDQNGHSDSNEYLPLKQRAIVVVKAKYTFQ